MKRLAFIAGLFLSSPLWGAVTTQFNSCTGCPDFVGSAGTSSSSSGTIIASPQFQVPYYSIPGTTNTVKGLSGVTTNGTGGLSVSSLTVNGSSETIQDGQGLPWIYNTGNRTNFFAGTGAGTVATAGTGINNTGVGGNALGSLTTASSSTALGQSAGANLTSGNGILLLGYGVQASNNLTNAIAMGDLVTVTASSTAVIGGAPNTPGSMNLIVSSISTQEISATNGLQINTPGDLNISGAIAGSTYAVVSTSFQITSGHLLCSNSTNYTAGDCGAAGAGGTPSGNAFDVQYASANGTQFAGSDNLKNNGTVVTLTNVSTFTQINVVRQLAPGVLFDYTGSTVIASAMNTANLNGPTQGTLNGTVVSSSPFTIYNNVQATTFTATGGMVIPTNSQNNGHSTLNQWFSQMATLQTLNPAPANKLSIFMLGDSHTAKFEMARPFSQWMQNNFGNAGTYVSLSTYSMTTQSMLPSGCFTSATGNWTNNPNNSAAMGLDDDEHSSTVQGSNLVMACPGGDSVILHYKTQPNGGKIKMTIDGGTPVITQSAGTLAISSLTISGLGYGYHSASITYDTAGTAGITVFDLVFFSSSTPGSILYRAATNGQTANYYTLQNATYYENLLAMLPSTPSVVMFQFGNNEEGQGRSPASMMTDIHTLFKRFQTVYPQLDCIYMSPPAAVNEGYFTYPVTAYESAMLSAAINDGCAFVDFSAYFSSETIFSNYYVPDGVHLNTQGGFVGGQLIINQLSNQLSNVTPFTFITSSPTISYGTQMATNTLNNIVSFGYNNQFSTNTSNSGAIGNNLTISTNGIFMIGNTLASGSGQNLYVTSATVNTISVASNTTLSGQINTTLTGSLPVQTTGGGTLTAAAVNLSGSQATGTMAAGRMPALTGDVTTSAGAVATTAAAAQTHITSITSALTLGAAANSVTISSNAIMPGATFYQSGPVSLQRPVGINNSAPSAALDVFGVTSDTYTVKIATSSVGFSLAVSTNGHIISNAALPTISSCGTTPNGSVVGDDYQGTITIGGGSVTACTLTFAQTYGVGCTVNCTTSDSITTATPDVVTTPTTMTLGFSATIGGGKVLYHCTGYGSACR